MATTDRRLPPVLRWTLTAAGVLVLGFLALTFVLGRFLDSERLAGWLTPRVEAALNRPVSVEGVDVGLFPLAARIDGLEVGDPTGLAPHLARLERLELRVRLLPLLGRSVEVKEVRLADLAVNLRVGDDGLTNYGDFSPQTETETETEPEADGPAGAPDPPFTLELQSLRLTGGRATFVSRADSLSATVDGLEGRWSVIQGADGSWRFDGATDGALTVARGASALVAGTTADEPLLRAVPVGLAAEVETDFDRAEILEGALTLSGARLALSGRADGLKEPVRQLALRVEADAVALDQVLEVARSARAAEPGSDGGEPRLSVQGSLFADLDITGALGPEQIPGITGAVRVEGGALALGDARLADALALEVGAAEDRTLDVSLTGRLLNGPLAARGRVGLADDPEADVRIEAAPDLSSLGPDVLPDEVALAGVLAADVQLTGNPTELTTLAAFGQITPRDVVVRHPALAVPARVGPGRVELEGQQVRIPDLTLGLGEDGYRFQGRLEDPARIADGGNARLVGRLSGALLDLNRVLARQRPDTALTYGRVAFARLGGRSVRGRSAEEAAQELGLSRPARLPLAGEVEVALDTLVDRTGRMENVRADVVFGPDFLQVTDATFRRYGGGVRASGQLSLGELADEPFDLRLEVDGVDAGAFLAETTPLGEAIRGSLDLQVQLAGTLDDLLLPGRGSVSGSGSFALTGGGLEETPLTRAISNLLGLPGLRSPSVQDWRTGFVLDQGRILLADAPLQGAPGDPRVGGSVGLDGALDMTSTFAVPRAQAGAEALQRLGVTPETAAQVVDAAVRIGGTLADPTVDGSRREAVEEAAAEAAESLREEAREAVEERIEEQRQELRDRASGFLRGLLRGRDTTAADSARARPDSVRPDTVGLPGDSVVRDTLPPDTVLLGLAPVPPVAGAAASAPPDHRKGPAGAAPAPPTSPGTAHPR